jgi:hypothetical protein
VPLPDLISWASAAPLRSPAKVLSAAWLTVSLGALPVSDTVAEAAPLRFATVALVVLDARSSVPAASVVAPLTAAWPRSSSVPCVRLRAVPTVALPPSARTAPLAAETATPELPASAVSIACVPALTVICGVAPLVARVSPPLPASV